MQWLLLCVCVCAAAAVELRCDPPGCVMFPHEYEKQKLQIDGKEVEMKYEETFYLDCHRNNVLQSPSMPRFTSEFRVPEVHLIHCRLPHNASIADILSALNITLQPVNGTATLRLYKIPPTPRIAPKFFSGLEIVTKLHIESTRKASEVPEGFLAGFPNLYHLSLDNVPLKAGELARLPRTLRFLELLGTSVKILPDSVNEAVKEASLAMPNLKDLVLSPKKRYNTPANSTVNKVDSVETVFLYYWTEKQLPPLDNCNRMRKFEVFRPALEQLPDSFTAACPVIEKVGIYFADYLQGLPEKLLEGAISLKIFDVNYSKLKTLPQGLFRGAPNLVNVDLANNELVTLPSGLFVGLQLKVLNLAYNRLETSALNELTSLTSITNLGVHVNPLGDVCDEFGYSPFKNMTVLKALEMSETGVTRICRDWRENLLQLEYLDLYETNITKLNSADLQYTRDPSITDAKVCVSLSVAVNFTQSDYNHALTAPKTDATMWFEEKDYFWFYVNNKTSIDCDSNKYWLKKATVDARHAVKIDGYNCRNENELNKLIVNEEKSAESKQTL